MEYIGNIKYDTILYEDRKFVIYGYGFYGKKLYELMQTMGIENKVVAFCDANAENEVYTIVHPKEAVRMENVDFLVIGNYEYDMVQYLISENISRIHILTL